MEQNDKFQRRPKYRLLSQLETKFKNICSILQDNKYPQTVINISIKQKTVRVNSKLREVPKRMPFMPLAFLARKNFS